MRMKNTRLFTQVEFGLAVAVIIGVFVQVYLIASYAFGADSISAHKDVGRLVHVLELLVFVAALLAKWPNWRKTGWPFALAAVGSVQAFLAAGGATSGNDWIHAFHGALALVVLLIAIEVAKRARDELGTMKSQSAST